MCSLGLWFSCVLWLTFEILDILVFGVFYGVNYLMKAVELACI